MIEMVEETTETSGDGRVTQQEPIQIDRVTRPSEARPLTVVTVDLPQLTDGSSLDRIQRDVLGLVAENPGLDLLVDLSSVNFLSSSAIGMLGMVHRKAWGSKGRMKICGIHPDVLGVLKITRLDTVFDILGPRAEAVAKF